MLHHARRVTGIDDIHAFIGGLHLTGGLFAPIILLMLVTIPRYLWMIVQVIHHGPPETELEDLIAEDAAKGDRS